MLMKKKIIMENLGHRWLDAILASYRLPALTNAIKVLEHQQMYIQEHTP